MALMLLPPTGIRPSPHTGIATSPGESYYPELFNSLTFATVPALASMCRFEDFSGKNRPTPTFPTMIRHQGEWAHEHGSTGDRTVHGLMDDLVPLSNATIICGYQKTDGTQRNGGIFGNSNITSSNYANLTSEWSDGKTYWQWGTVFINDIDHGFGAIDYGTNKESHFGCVASSDRGMEMWHNGIIAASSPTDTHSRTAGSGNLVWGHHNANGSDLVAYRYIMAFNRALAVEELELLGRNPYAIFEQKRFQSFFVAAATEHTESESHTLGITDSEVSTLDHNRTEADTLGISDAIVLAGDWARSESDDIGVTDTVVHTGDFPRSLSDTLGITDSATTFDTFSETVTDPITFVSTGSGVALNLDNLFIVVQNGKLQRQPTTETIRARGDINLSSYEIYADNEVYQRIKRTSITADLTVTDETWILADATSGAITITLPPAASFVDRQIEVTKKDAVNTVTVDADGSETISGSLTIEITAQYDNLSIMSDGTEWFII